MSPPSWESIATSGLPTAREEASSYTWRGRLCLFGGRGTKPVDCFDSNTNEWKSSKAVTHDIHHIQPVVWRGEVWVVTGWTGWWPDMERELPRVLVYNPDTDELRENCTIPVEYRRGAAGVVVHNDTFYIVSGAVNGHLKMYGAYAYRDFTRFDPVGCKWSNMSSRPAHHRDHFQAALVGSRIVVAGGRDSPRGGEMREVCHWTTRPTEWFDLAAAGGWQEGAGIPTPRAGAASVADAQGRLLVIGGETDAGNGAPERCQGHPTPNLAHDTIERYDLFANSWTKLPSMNVGRHACGAAWLPAPAPGSTAASSSSGPLDQLLVVAAGVGCTGGAPLLTDTEEMRYSET